MPTSHSPVPSRPALASVRPIHRHGERGAVLVNAAIALIGLISFSALVIDYGILWAARRQAQNAADAGAMAAAVSLGYVDFTNQALARTAALNTARSNFVWGVAPDITDADVDFPPCPPGSPGAGANACVRVNVFRNQRAGGSPLPTIFGRLAGVMDQGVRATATAEVLFGNSSTCVKPWAIPDKWQEGTPTPVVPWTPDSDFSAYDRSGTPLIPADYYRPPVGTDPGTGFASRDVGLGTDYGLQLTLKTGGPADAIAPGWFYPVVVDPDCRGGNCYREAIENCAPLRYGDDAETLTVEPGNMVGPTRQGVEALIALDPGARWNTTTKNYENSCVQASPTTCPQFSKSPRLVAVPLFDPDAYNRGRASGRQDIVITKILGFFVERMNGDEVVGRLCFYPDEPHFVPGTDVTNPASFIVSIALVR